MMEEATEFLQGKKEAIDEQKKQADESTEDLSRQV